MSNKKDDQLSSSSISGFYKKTRDQRLDTLLKLGYINHTDIETLKNKDYGGGLAFEHANAMVENAIGVFGMPLGVATNFVINGKDVLVPMVIEEPSVIAAASKGAKATREMGGFTATMSSETPYSIGQIQLLNVSDVKSAIDRIHNSERKIISLANGKRETDPSIKRGAKSVSCRTIDTPSNGTMLIVELLIDTDNAMGANMTNSMCEAVSPLLEQICNENSDGGARALLRILSNYSTHRTVTAKGVFAKDSVGGADTVNDIISAFEFADCDIYRAVTHNKGVMNGIIAVANATGQDSRAIEAAANAYASRTGRYRSITQWSKDENGNLVGEIELPLSVGIVGGVTKVHPIAKLCVNMLKVKSANDLACIMASAGLAQNYAAMRALVTDGIQKGHMSLHARNFASEAGAKFDEIDNVVKEMILKGDVSVQGAKHALDSIRSHD